MSAERIDVLAYLDTPCPKMQAVRTAVAELVEAGEPVAQKMEQEDYPEWPDDARVEVVLTLGEMRRFRAALARIGGAT